MKTIIITIPVSSLNISSIDVAIITLNAADVTSESFFLKMINENLTICLT